MVQLSQHKALDAPRHTIPELGLGNPRHDDLPFLVDHSAGIRNIGHCDPESHPVPDFKLPGQKIVAPGLDDLLDDQSIRLLVPIVKLVLVVDDLSLLLRLKLQDPVLPLHVPVLRELLSGLRGELLVLLDEVLLLFFDPV